jgi:hypothetical protein
VLGVPHGARKDKALEVAAYLVVGFRNLTNLPYLVWTQLGSRYLTRTLKKLEDHPWVFSSTRIAQGAKRMMKNKRRRMGI